MAKERVSGYKRRNGTVVKGYMRKKRGKAKVKGTRLSRHKARRQRIDAYGRFV